MCKLHPHRCVWVGGWLSTWVCSIFAYGFKIKLTQMKNSLFNGKIALMLFNPRLTKGGGLLQPPLRFFPGSSKTLKKVTKGI